MATTLIPYDIGCEPSPSVPSETLLQDGWSTYLLFFAVSKSVDESGCLKDLGVAVLDCKKCVTSRFGYPNDEGLPEHPLYDCSMESVRTSILEVLESSWVTEVSQQLEASSRRIWGSRGMEASTNQERTHRHFIITLKEATFECIASSLAVEQFFGTFADALAHVTGRLKEH